MKCAQKTKLSSGCAQPMKHQHRPAEMPKSQKQPEDQGELEWIDGHRSLPFWKRLGAGGDGGLAPSQSLDDFSLTLFQRLSR